MAIDWEELEAIENGWKQIRSERFPTLSSTYVGGEGDNPEAFIVGTAPDAQATVKGRPFMGTEGHILRQLMRIADLYAAADGQLVEPVNCWLTNVVKFRPPKNRNPLDVEVKAARPLLLREWHAVGKPRLIIPVGGIALQAITGKRISILRAAGKCHWYRTGTNGIEIDLAVWPMVHPAYVLKNRTRSLEKLIEEDWERLGVWRNAN